MFHSRPLLVIFIIMCLFAARALYQKLYDPQRYRAQYYSVRFPEGWQKKKEEKGVVFLSPEKEQLNNQPVATLAVYSEQSRDALFLEDLFPQILDALHNVSMGEIVDKGQIEVDGEVAGWVLFHNKNKDAVTLSFYVVDSFNRLTNIEFSAKRDKFQDYRPVFEEFRESFKFKKMF